MYGAGVGIMGKAGVTREALALGQRTLGEGQLPGKYGGFSSDLREEATPWEQTAPEAQNGLLCSEGLSPQIKGSRDSSSRPKQGFQAQ